MFRAEQFSNANAGNSTDASATLFSEYQKAPNSNNVRADDVAGTDDIFDPNNLAGIFADGQRVGQELAAGDVLQSKTDYNLEFNQIKSIADPNQQSLALQSFIHGLILADPTDVHTLPNADGGLSYSIDFTTEGPVSNSLNFLGQSSLSPSDAASSMTEQLKQLESDIKNLNDPDNHPPIDHAVFIADFNRRRAQSSQLADYIACENRDGGISILYLGMHDVPPPSLK